MWADIEYAEASFLFEEIRDHLISPPQSAPICVLIEVTYNLLDAVGKQRLQIFSYRAISNICIFLLVPASKRRHQQQE
jgi:hypothetical protein